MYGAAVTGTCDPSACGIKSQGLNLSILSPPTQFLDHFAFSCFIDSYYCSLCFFFLLKQFTFSEVVAILVPFEFNSIQLRVD